MGSNLIRISILATAAILVACIKTPDKSGRDSIIGVWKKEVFADLPDSTRGKFVEYIQFQAEGTLMMDSWLFDGFGIDYLPSIDSAFHTRSWSQKGDTLTYIVRKDSLNDVQFWGIFRIASNSLYLDQSHLKTFPAAGNPTAFVDSQYAGDNLFVGFRVSEFAYK